MDYLIFFALLVIFSFYILTHAERKLQHRGPKKKNLRSAKHLKKAHT